MPDQVRDADEHEQREHQREELHAFRAGGAADRAGDELVGDFGDRLHAAREPAAGSTPPIISSEITATATKHVERRVGEGDRVLADMADREEGLDIELMDRVDFHPRGSLIRRPLAGNRISNVVTSRRALSACAEATPADLTTLTTPATKPSSKNTMRPNGDVDNKRSKPQPIPLRRQRPRPTPRRGGNRAPWQMLWRPCLPLSVPGWSVLILRLSRISDNR